MTTAISEMPEDELASAAGLALLEVLRRTHLSAAHDLSTVVAEEARTIGIAGLVMYLVNLEQTELIPVPGPDTGEREPLSLGGTVGGRSYTGGTILDTVTNSGRRVWLPLLDGTERLGVVELLIDDPDELPEHVVAILERYAHFVAGLIVTKDPYSDVFELLRRSQRMTTATELMRDMVPPTTIATDDFVLGTMLEPAYDVGGDAYDYALNHEILHLGIFDGVGHGLAAAGVSTFALSAYRHARRTAQDLPATYAAIDAEVAEQYPTSRYVTACLAQLDVTTGHLRWISAGHPAPLLLRRGRFVKELGVHPSPPMGLLFANRPPVIGQEALEPGDMVLFYTDGLTESRRPDGRLFTTERLAEFIERQAGSGEAAPETLRRLREAIIERGEGTLRDDATAMLLEWRRGAQERVLPETVLAD
ncbi:MAG TPA: PP2C family protein-serine/threonine phosphatase [Solirubrobacteraceae bacterium]|nr:PP2C family protein-serine/threonine phosphatase [Solirubrobacteraceae bacterium]